MATPEMTNWQNSVFKYFVSDSIICMERDWSSGRGRLIAHVKLAWRAILSRNNHFYSKDGIHLLRIVYQSREIYQPPKQSMCISQGFSFEVSTWTVIDGNTRDDKLTKECFQVFCSRFHYLHGALTWIEVCVSDGERERSLTSNEKPWGQR